MRFFFSMFTILLIFTSCVASQPYNTRYGNEIRFNGNDNGSAIVSQYVPPVEKTPDRVFERPQKTYSTQNTGTNVIRPYEAPSNLVSCTKSKSNYRILIDPGHGGTDRGGAANGIIEKDLVLKISLQVVNLLKENGFTVYTTRSSDVFPSLADRVARSKSVNASLMVSIHANVLGDTSKRGTETIYPKSSASGWNTTQSHNLADAIQYRYKKFGSQDLYRSRVDYRNLYILRNAKVPTVITEIGCMTNKEDAKLLKQADHQKYIVESIYNGIVTYLNNR